MRVRHLYIPIDTAKPGMVLGSSVCVAERGYLSLSLPAGLTLTEENIHQLCAHNAEFIDIEQPDSRCDEQVGIDMAQAAHRVMQIFAGVDLSDSNMAALFDQVLGYRCA